jgi:hypothetical protein
VLLIRTIVEGAKPRQLVIVWFLDISGNVDIITQISSPDKNFFDFLYFFQGLPLSSILNAGLSSSSNPHNSRTGLSAEGMAHKNLERDGII